MCAVPGIAVVCSESIECFPGTAPNFPLDILLPLRWLHLLPV